VDLAWIDARLERWQMYQGTAEELDSVKTADEDTWEGGQRGDTTGGKGHAYALQRVLLG
jgi:hypothetical protein